MKNTWTRFLSNNDCEYKACIGVVSGVHIDLQSLNIHLHQVLGPFFLGFLPRWDNTGTFWSSEQFERYVISGFSMFGKKSQILIDRFAASHLIGYTYHSDDIRTLYFCSFWCTLVQRWEMRCSFPTATGFLDFWQRSVFLVVSLKINLFVFWAFTGNVTAECFERNGTLCC